MSPTPPSIEVCVESMQGLHAAERCGATRVELCSNLSLGGTTPSAGLIQGACQSGAKVIVLLRPRAGDFIYSETEFDIILRDLEFAKSSGATGVAFGLLDARGDLELDRCREFMRLAEGLQVCFHRAFDFTREPSQALEDLVQLKLHRILTSGAQANALQGLETITSLVKQAAGRIEIMPAGGVREDNIRHILDTSGALSVHFSASEFLPSSSVQRNPNCSLEASGRPTEHERHQTSEAGLRAIIHAAKA